MSEKVTFRELIDSIASQTDNPKKFTHDFLKDLVSVINSSLEEDGKVNIAGFGKFELRHMNQRQGYNPQTGEKMTIPEHNKVVFKPYKDLRELVNAPYIHLEPRVIDEDEGTNIASGSATEAGTSDSGFIETEESAGQVEKHEEIDRDFQEESDSTPGKQRFVFDDPGEKEEQKSEEADPVSGEKEEPSPPLGQYIDKAKSKKPEPEVPEQSVTAETESKAIFRRTPRHSTTRSRPLPKGLIAAAAVVLIMLLGTWFLIPGSGSDEPTPSLSAVQQSQQDDAVQEPGNQTQNESAAQPSQPAVSSQNPAIQQPDTPQQQDHVQLTIDEGQSLWSIANNNYQDPYLWPWIYDANKNSITNPNLILAGRMLEIPMPDEPNLGLSSTDSLEVALGYVETYRWHKETQNEDARLYLRAATRYHEDVLDNVTQPIDEADLAFANGVR